jgi:ATP-binding cassette subfamily D (ALD) protein 3
MQLEQLVRNKRVVGASLAVGAVLFLLSKRSSSKPASPKSSSSSSKRKSVKVDALFLTRLRKMLGLCMPSWCGTEAGLVMLLTVLLVVRTRLTIRVAQSVGKNAKYLVQRDAHKFIASVLDIGLWSLPSAVVNTGINYTTSMIEACFRENVQRRMHLSYLAGGAVCKAANGALDNPDHRLTSDVQSFCNEVSGIYPQMFKPTVDIITFIYALSKTGGAFPPMLMCMYYLVAGAFMRMFMPNYAKLTATTQQKEGDYRRVHTQMMLHAEEVAFYRGERTECSNANKSIDSLLRHLSVVKGHKTFSDFMDAVLIKYGATCVGYAVCSIGVFAVREGSSVAQLTEVYIRNSQLYIPLAQAIGKMVLLYGRVTALAAYTSRVSELDEALDSIAAATKGAEEHVTEVARSDKIVFDGVTISPPRAATTDDAGAGAPLISNLNLTVQRGTNLLIMGTNGSGKSSLLRVMLGLWGCDAGHVTRPPLSDFTFLSQKTYLPQGNLRTQLVFPDTREDALAKGVTDEELMTFVTEMGLSTVVEREGGLDARKDWHEVLSGGERQRIAFCRLLYHRPIFGVLDESTSATSQDIEPVMYEAALKRGITLLTVSHRETLMRYHQQVLVLDGAGGHTVSNKDK